MRTSGIACLLALAAACTGDIDGVVTTDFGDAVAASQRTDTGISSWLVSGADGETLGELHWNADTMGVDASLAGAPMVWSGPADLDGAELTELNLFLYALWEVEREPPAGTTCVENAVAICCRSDAWTCGTRVQ